MHPVHTFPPYFPNIYPFIFRVVSSFQDFRLKFCTSPMHATFAVHLILLDLITLNVTAELINYGP